MTQKKIDTNSIIVVFVIALSFVVFHQYIFDGKYFLPKGILSDTLRISLPTYYHMYDNLIKDTNFWSWSIGIGTSMFAHADVYCDPFTYIIFLGGRDLIPQMLIWSLVIKIICEALSFSYYLRFYSLHKYAVIFASVVYAFSGYSLVMGGNLTLGTILVYAPLVFRGIENYINNGDRKLLLLSLFLVCIYSYYYFYIIGILSLIYMIYRYRHFNRKMLVKIVGLIATGFTSMCLSAFTLLPQLQLVLNSTRTGSGSDIIFDFRLFIPQLQTMATAIIRSFGNNMLGDAINSPYVGYSYNLNNDYFQTDWYVTALFIPLFFQLLYYRKKSSKIILTALAILGVSSIPVVSYAFNAFSTINYRWMFIITFIIAIMTAFSIDTIINKKRINITIYFLSLIFAFGIIIISFFILGNWNINTTKNIITNIWIDGKLYIEILIIDYILFGVLAIILNSSIIPRVKKHVVILLGTTIICIDILGNYYLWYSSDSTTCNYNIDKNSGYEDGSLEVIKEIQNNTPPLYRINKNFDSVIDMIGIPSNSDAMAQKYYGLKSYCSLNNPNYVSFLQELGIYVVCPLSIDYYKALGITPKGIVGADLNYINGVGDNYKLMGYLGVKYLLMQSGTSINSEHLNYLGSMNNIDVYENKGAYPIGFINYAVMSKEEFDHLDNDNKVDALCNFTIVENDAITECTDVYDTKHTVIESARKKQRAFKLLHFDNDALEFKIYANAKAQYLSFTIPYDTDWHIYIDGEEVKTCKLNISMLGCKISKGNHIVTLQYIPHMFYTGVIITIITGLIILNTLIKKYLLLENN